MSLSVKAMPQRCLAIGLVLAMIMPSLAGASRSHGLDDLRYESKSRAERELRSRGYVQMDKDHHAGAFYQYWWNDDRNTCVSVRYEDDEVTDVDRTSSTDCNQYHEEATKDDASAAAAIGAVALIAGIAALSHKSHQRDETHDDDRSIAEFERGYRDGLYNQDYHNYDKTDAYSDGFSQGVEERHENTSYRSHHGSHHSGYRDYVYVGDLEGARASSADSELGSRGFTDKGGYKRGGRSYTMWWNGGTRQCLEVETSQGRIQSIDTIDEGNCL